MVERTRGKPTSVQATQQECDPSPSNIPEMSNRAPNLNPLGAIWGFILDISFFWIARLYAWLWKKSPKEELSERLAQAQDFDEWEAIAGDLDTVLGFDVWRLDPSSKLYDWRLVNNRLQALQNAREDQELATLVNVLRSGMVRNLGNITSPRLFNTAYAGTKHLIEQYISELALSVEDLETWPVTPGSTIDITNQAKMNVFHDARQAFGRSALVLQGGAMFGLCHLGVVKALHLKGLLPRIITGTATGALIAALVAVHREEELTDVLTADGINLKAFARGPSALKPTSVKARSLTLWRRLNRLIRDGHFLDMDMLRQCLLDNVGDMTFEEAYNKTNRILNITVPAAEGEGMPSLLNHITAPHVLIWSAALASNATVSPLYSGLPLKWKEEDGTIMDWPSDGASAYRPWAKGDASGRETPLTRVAELFNVNHFIISQARPYLAPLLQSDLHRHNPRANAGTWGLSLPIGRLLILEIQHRLRQLDSLGYMAAGIRRFLLDENIPGPSLTFVPELTASDFAKLLERPSKDSIESWILRGERSVWPAISALTVRCAVETKLDGAYERVRRGVTYDVVTDSWPRSYTRGGAKFRTRSTSLGQDTI